jgi:glycosyltransferase involved in cell wall biosynthesis
MFHPANRPTPLLVFADDWGRHPSSCQHLVRRLRHDCRVLWANSIGTRQVRADSVTFRRALHKLRNWARGLTQVSEQMWAVDLPMLPGGGRRFRGANRMLVTTRLRGLLAELEMTRPFVLTTLPYIYWFVRDLPRRGLIYYCTDDYSQWPSADGASLRDAERDLCRAADLILPVSRVLYERHAHTGRCSYFPHAVDYAHFASVARHSDVPPEVARLPGPRIGFFGLIYEKLDFPLLAALARRFPDASLVLIGPVVCCPNELTALPNVHLLGPKPYEELPRYLAGLDVLLMPYIARDEMIRQSNPLKLRECLASGKPTVSVDVPEVRLLEPHVRVAADHESFLCEVASALREPSGDPAAAARQRAVEPDGWDNRARELRSLLGQVEAGRLAAPRTGAPPAAPRRVLHLRTVTGPGGGPEKTLLNSPRFLRGAYDVRLAYIRPEHDPGYDLPARAARMGVDLVDVAERGAVDVRTLWRLAGEVRSFRPHLLHAHDYKTNVLAVVLGSLFGTPAVTTLHGYVTRGGRLEAYYMADRWALRGMRHVIAVSPDLYRLARTWGVPRARLSLVENAIDAEQFRRRLSRADAKKRLGLDPDRPVVGAVGRLSPEKGFDVLIRAAGLLAAEGVRADVYVVGEGADRARLEALAAGPEANVRLLGHRADVPDWYEAMDVFVLSSLREGLPNVVLEAMAMEVPVLATRVAGVPRLIADERTGLLVEPGDAAALAAALARLLSVDGLRARLASEARRAVETSYSFAARMRKIRAIYDKVLAGV